MSNFDWIRLDRTRIPRYVKVGGLIRSRFHDLVHNPVQWL